MQIIRRQLLYAMKPEGSFYTCIKFQSKVPTQSEDINQLSVILTDPRTCILYVLSISERFVFPDVFAVNLICVWSMFCDVVHCALSSIAFILIVFSFSGLVCNV